MFAYYYYQAIVIFTITFLISTLYADVTLAVKNNCGSVVTVGILTNGVSASFPEDSFDLTPGASNSFSRSDTWGGRVWGRYQCSGSAGKDANKCGVPGASNPATLAEFFFKGAGGKDFYDVSLVDGYNIPIAVNPGSGTSSSGTYNCGSPSCKMDSCPDEYAVKDATGNVVSCQSACSKTGSSQDCCTGDYNTPDSCKASGNADAVKSACPDAYSFAYDDQKSTFECQSETYNIDFC